MHNSKHDWFAIFSLYCPSFVLYAGKTLVLDTIKVVLSKLLVKRFLHSIVFVRRSSKTLLIDLNVFKIYYCKNHLDGEEWWWHFTQPNASIPLMGVT